VKDMKMTAEQRDIFASLSEPPCC